MVNIGILNEKFLKEVVNNIIDNSNPEINNKFKEYNEIIKKSDLLLMEFMIYENLSNKMDIKENGLEYINEMLSSLDNVSLDELVEERSKLEEYMQIIDLKNSINELEDNSPIYEAIKTLIDNKVFNNKVKDTKMLWESKTVILENLMSESTHIQTIKENESNFTLSNVLHLSNKKFNTKVLNLDESDKDIIKAFYNKNEDTMESSFLTIKEKTLAYLNEQDKKEVIDEGTYKEAVTKINEMSYNKDTFVDDIVLLCDLTTEEDTE